MEPRSEQRVSGDLEHYSRHLYHIDDGSWERTRPSRSRKRAASELSRVMLGAKLLRLSNPPAGAPEEIDFGCFFLFEGECIKKMNKMVCTCEQKEALSGRTVAR